MPDNYDLPIDEVIDRLDHIERRLDNMEKSIGFLNSIIYGRAGITGYPETITDFVFQTSSNPPLNQLDTPSDLWARCADESLRKKRTPIARPAERPAA